MKRTIAASRLLIAMLILLGFALGCGEGPFWPCGADWSPVEYPPRNDDMVTIGQGIWGDVWFWEGDFMPMCPTGTVTAVAREMQVRELTTFDDVEHDSSGHFYTEVRTAIVAEGSSDASGFFEIELEPGRYSLFAVEDTLFYANGSDGLGNIYPVTVDSGQVADVRFDITYGAAW